MDGKPELSLTLTRAGRTLRFEPACVAPAAKAWQVQLHGLAGFQSIQGGKAQTGLEGTQFIPDDPAKAMEIVI